MTRGFTVVTDPQPETDFVFASEYFEHFQRPIEHLRDVLRVAEPKHLVIANAFGSKSIGHFDIYLDEENLFDSRQVLGASVGRLFNDVLRKNGYATVKTEFWNNRPAVWRRRV